MAGLIKSGSNRRGRKNLNSDINITPFVDVMLVLLIIFMVTSPMLVTGVKLDLPDSDNVNPLNLKEEPLTIDIDKFGKIYIQEINIDIKNLSKKLIAITGEKLDSRIVIRGDKSSDYGMVMEVIAAINSAGFNKISLINTNKIRSD